MLIAICGVDENLRNEQYILCDKFYAKKDILIEIIEFTSGREMLECNKEIDLAFMEIEQDTNNDWAGKPLSVSERLKMKGSECSIILLTENAEPYNNFYWANVCGFLAKEFEDEHFNKCLKSFHDKVVTMKKVIQLDKNNFEIKSNIVYIKAADKYCEIHATDRTYYIRRKMYELEEELCSDTSDGFVRVHRSYIINFKYVGKMDGAIYMKDGSKINCSRGKWTEVKSEYYKFRRYAMLTNY